MKRLIAITAVMILASSLFFVGVCVAGHPVEKPASGMWSGIIYDVGFCEGSTPQAPIIQAINVGKGVSTLTGKSDWFSVFCTYCSIPNGNRPPFFCDELSGSGWGIITAANGDKLHLELPEVGVDLTATPPIWTEHEHIVGGTGRFEGATGESNSQGTWTAGTSFPAGGESPALISPPQGWVGTNEGTITY